MIECILLALLGLLVGYMVASTVLEARQQYWMNGIREELGMEKKPIMVSLVKTDGLARLPKRAGSSRSKK